MLKQTPDRLRGSFVNGIDSDGAKAIRLVELAIVEARAAPKFRTNDNTVPLPERAKPSGLGGSENGDNRRA